MRRCRPDVQRRVRVEPLERVQVCGVRCAAVDAVEVRVPGRLGAPRGEDAQPRHPGPRELRCARAARPGADGGPSRRGSAWRRGASLSAVGVALRLLAAAGRVREEACAVRRGAGDRLAIAMP